MPPSKDEIVEVTQVLKLQEPDVIPISFSQSGTWETCKRQWALNKVDQIEGLPNYVGEAGKIIHEEIEDYLLGFGEENHETLYAQQALQEIGAVEYKIEEAVQLSSEDFLGEPGYLLRGIQDVVGVLEDGCPFVLDWKNPRKKPWKLRDSYWEQVALYAYMNDFPEGTLLVVAFPLYEMFRTQNYDPEYGEEVVVNCFAAAKEIKETKAYLTPGMATTPTVNNLCAEWCSYRDICDAWKETS